MNDGRLKVFSLKTYLYYYLTTQYCNRRYVITAAFVKEEVYCFDRCWGLDIWHFVAYGQKLIWPPACVRAYPHKRASIIIIYLFFFFHRVCLSPFFKNRRLENAVHEKFETRGWFDWPTYAMRVCVQRALRTPSRVYFIIITSAENAVRQKKRKNLRRVLVISKEPSHS